MRVSRPSQGGKQVDRCALQALHGHLVLDDMKKEKATRTSLFALTGLEGAGLELFELVIVIIVIIVGVTAAVEKVDGVAVVVQ